MAEQTFADLSRDELVNLVVELASIDAPYDNNDRCMYCGMDCSVEHDTACVYRRANAIRYSSGIYVG